MKRKRSKKPEAAARVVATPVAVAEPRNKTIRWVHGAALVALLVANLGLYHRAANLDFLSVDDADYVQNNPYIESFSAANLKHICTQAYAANYAPANLPSYSLDV